MSTRMIILLAFLSALWIFGLVGQFHSAEAGMRYLALSMAILAIGAALRRRYRERPRPPE